MSQSKDSHQL